MDFTKTIFPLALTASESIAHSAFGSSAIDSEPIRARGIIVNYHKGENKKNPGFSVVFLSGKELTNGNLVLEFKNWSTKLYVHDATHSHTSVKET